MNIVCNKKASYFWDPSKIRYSVSVACLKWRLNREGLFQTSTCDSRSHVITGMSRYFAALYSQWWRKIFSNESKGTISRLIQDKGETFLNAALLGFFFENSTVKSSNTNEEMWIQYNRNIGKQFRWTVLKNNILTTKYRYSVFDTNSKGFLSG